MSTQTVKKRTAQPVSSALHKHLRGRPNEANQVNVVATVLILLSLIPVYFSQKAQENQSAK